jgi:hypothetical protein
MDDARRVARRHAGRPLDVANRETHFFNLPRPGQDAPGGVPHAARDREYPSPEGRMVISTTRTDRAFGPYTERWRSLVNESSNALERQRPASEAGNTASLVADASSASFGAGFDCGACATRAPPSNTHKRRVRTASWLLS